MSLESCRECGKSVSTEATTCPSCGCPLRPTPAATVAADTASQRKSHMYGWLALIAFLMSNFIPAILAPLVVLVAFVFAVLETNKGNKSFGGILFALCALQTWFIADHFGGLSGSLGITTPKKIEEVTAKKYSTTNLEISSDSNQIIQQKCEEEWPSDFRMRRYCQEQQNEGIVTLSHGRPNSVNQEAFVIIRGKCAEEWPRDFKMRAYCESQQYEGYHALQAESSSQAERGACAQKWPNDYKMRQYCESH